MYGPKWPYLLGYGSRDTRRIDFPRVDWLSTDTPVLRCHSMDGDGIDHGIENHVKINTQLLVKAFSNKTSFILSNRAIGILFDANFPLCSTPGSGEQETKCRSR